MKKILVACACAAGMLLMLSSSCDDDDFTGPAGKQRGCSGNPIQEFDFVCNTSGGTLTGSCSGGLARARVTTSTSCSTSSSYCYNPPAGGCFSVSGGIVTISFGMDPFTGVSLEFLVDEADVMAKATDLDVGTAVVAGTSIVFKAQKTGRCIKLFDSSLCFIPDVNVINHLSVTAWTDEGSGTLGAGDTIAISWNETRAHEVEDDDRCDSNGAVIACGTAVDIPYS